MRLKQRSFKLMIGIVAIPLAAIMGVLFIIIATIFGIIFILNSLLFPFIGFFSPDDLDLSQFRNWWYKVEKKDPYEKYNKYI